LRLDSPVLIWHWLILILRWLVLILDWFVAVAWLKRVLDWRHRVAQVPDLAKNSVASQSQAQSGLAVRLSVIVPARNEAAKIAATLQSLLDSSGVDLEILAVDDRSTDETGAIMDRMADAITDRMMDRMAVNHPRLRVLHIRELPAGWLGKTHAMAVAAREATGQWLLFTDGDVVFSPEVLTRGLGFAVASEADHFVLLPTVLLESWGEKIMVSLLQVIAIWGPRPWRIPDPQARDSIGVGAFNMLRREAYDAIGGWEALRMEVVEDLALGSLIKKKGLRQRIALGRGLVSVRWVEGASGMVENLAKNLFAVFRFRVRVLLGAVLLFALFTLYPLAMLATGAAAARWAAGVMLIAVFLAYRCQSRYQPFSAWEMIWFPAASALMLYIFLRSMFVVLMRGGVTWRGTFYSLRELRQYQRSRD
jgi:glycosyltransferase involved in cell wall biosynthesis